MAKEITNFGRFYTAIRALNPIGDRDDVKKSIVLQYTNGRTDSLREMSRAEYDRCCDDLERKFGRKEELRRERSATLKLMQKMGVDTTDWGRVNLLCRDARIIGKDFYYITADEHRELRRKLHGIERKGGFSRRQAERPECQKHEAQRQVIVVPMGNIGQA